ncbi:DUF2252 domain-containing protein [soil metagenome]
MTLDPGRDDERGQHIVDVLVEAFRDLMEADPQAFRRKFRKMAAEPFAFYRGSAPLFYADVANLDDPYADERTSRIWIQGDLHAENFGTYLDGEGYLIFDVNDFDEAYLGHFTWDVQRFAASVALMGWTKALPDEAIRGLIETYTQAYVAKVRDFAEGDRDHEFALRLDSTDGAVRDTLIRARLATRVQMLSKDTVVDGDTRRFREGEGYRRLDDAEHAKVVNAYQSYLETIPPEKRFRDISYTVKDIAGRSGFGIGSAGLPTYNVLVEGQSQALENDIVLSMKQGNVAAPSRVVDDERIRRYFHHHGHRTAVSQLALQAHADPYLGHTEIDGTGFVVSELSPHQTDLEWESLTEPDEMEPVLRYLGQASAKVHCVSDADSEQTLVDFQVEDAIVEVIGDDVDGFVRHVVDFATSYAERTRGDHRLFVDAFREGRIPGVSAT